MLYMWETKNERIDSTKLAVGPSTDPTDFILKPRRAVKRKRERSPRERIEEKRWKGGEGRDGGRTRFVCPPAHVHLYGNSFRSRRSVENLTTGIRHKSTPGQMSVSRNMHGWTDDRILFFASELIDSRYFSRACKFFVFRYNYRASI